MYKIKYVIILILKLVLLNLIWLQKLIFLEIINCVRQINVCLRFIIVLNHKN